MLDCEIGEQETALPSWEVPLVEDDSVRFGGNPSREEDLQLSLLTRLLPGSCLDLEAVSYLLRPWTRLFEPAGVGRPASWPFR
jgi:hypothetical protein